MDYRAIEVLGPLVELLEDFTEGLRPCFAGYAMAGTLYNVEVKRLVPVRHKELRVDVLLGTPG